MNRTTALPLKHAVGIERQLVVHDPVAVFLQVETFTGGVRTDQEQDLRLGEVGESLFPLGPGEAAIKPNDPAFVSVALQKADQPLDRGGVLREEDDLVVGVTAVDPLQFRQQHFGFRLGVRGTVGNELLQLQQVFFFLFDRTDLLARSTDLGEKTTVEVDFELRQVLIRDGLALA